MITISGKVTKDSNGNYYINSTRTSGTIDTIPILLTNINEGTQIEVQGELRSYNTADRKLKIYIAPTTITSYKNEINDLTLTGYICKSPTYRTTPLGKRITDLIITDGENYFPVIAWNKLAEDTKDMTIGNEITIHGRIQSRTYIRALDHTPHTTYEISILDTINAK